MSDKAYKYRFYPTAEQEQLLAQTFGCVRFVYNHILRWRTDAYYEHKEKINYKIASAKLTQVKKKSEFEWLNDVSCVPLQQCLRNQQSAFKNFFEGRAKYPKFKSKKHKQSAEFTKSAFKFKDSKIYIAKSIDPLDIKWSRKLPSDPSSITISKDCAGRYFVSCKVVEKKETLPINANVVGVDVGIESLLTLSNGKKINNPRHTKKYEKKLAKYQRRLSKKKLGSSNRNKVRIKVARIHAKISDCRSDFLHKTTSKLINDNQVVCIETLKVKNMIKNPKLAKHIADASWGEMFKQLEYKAKEAGRELVAIDQFFPSSKRCNECGFVHDSMPLDVRSWDCPECSTRHNRDHNAAKNIKAVGQIVLAFGESVSLL